MRLRERLESTLASLLDSQRATQAGATHEEARPEHAKDTRATEASYLARGLARRVEDLRAEIAALASVDLRDFGDDDRVALSAIVELCEPDGAASFVWLVPVGGGEPLCAGGATIRCVTPRSPLGRSLLGREVGDEVVLDLPGGRRPVEIASIR